MRSLQLLGTGAWVGSIVLWIVFLWFNPYSRSGRTVGSAVVVTTMIALGVLGVYGTWTRRPGLLYLGVGLSFCPVGFYVLLTPGIFRAIGILNLLALLAAILLHRRIRTAMHGGLNGRSYSARSPEMRGE
ncbi:MAG TPA: hypothetical protein VLG15_14515 [Thermoanaerobaculia bacterium]|nr:hypothetical protein [Thermoanaerobaculia bacterium]